MTNPTIPQRVLFPELVGKPVVATFDREQASATRARRHVDDESPDHCPRPQLRPRRLELPVNSGAKV